jgi:hypothetical protein
LRQATILTTMLSALANLTTSRGIYHAAPD